MKNDVAAQFQLLNKHIAAAISAQDYARATALDRARQEILRDICLMDKSQVDPDFFNIVEDCARENTLLIQTVQASMLEADLKHSRSLKAQNAYMKNNGFSISAGNS